jgi:AAA15 family ATPase/GTPase
MERLRIKNFLIIEEADFEVGRFNIIIGSQASGKSIIAKLLYFFRVHSKYNDKLAENAALDEFVMFFPKYVWDAQSFEIYYQNSDFEIVLSYDSELKISFSDKKIETAQKTLFIPANRTSFSLIQDNIFSLLRNGVELDLLIQTFGSYYEQAKKNYQNNRGRNRNDVVDDVVENILKGKYVYDAGQDYIKVNKQIIRLCDTSSGQQEALPMLILLSSLANDSCKKNVVIEEPEAHLFPVSQKRIIELLSLLYNKYNADFVLTTHSPYILTAINNAILAHDVITEKGKEAVKDIFDPDFAIKYEDVRAYTIEDGKLMSILDDDTRLIGASVIDSVSDEFENVFNSLLEL